MILAIRPNQNYEFHRDARIEKIASELCQTIYRPVQSANFGELFFTDAVFEGLVILPQTGEHEGDR